MAGRLKENDPRVIRTRQLIQDAFHSLSKEKKFNDITIRDITERAAINRGTFYAHFADKYALMELIIEDTFMTTVYQQLQSQEELTPEALRNLIISVCRYHEQLSTSCRRTAQAVFPLIEMKVKSQLEQMVSNWLAKRAAKPEADKSIQWAAVMVSQSIYGAAYLWNARGRKPSVTIFADEILCFLLPGLQAVIEKED
ncbi:TetR/AcrR family transcriptional regulator [Sporomusa termitida]|uniref:Putative dihydroxyacetone kinase regulator n=1 Tax=Sporomusa termitida TaxID=2377 RepID=A0A517DV93_9FIRM|nr:TetR family transcriptional regulator [Sporomusa termitida]QDR81253.1 putative dihydroxyacetone kinase regulator [Sporomusa termitida]